MQGSFGTLLLYVLDNLQNLAFNLWGGHHDVLLRPAELEARLMTVIYEISSHDCSEMRISDSRVLRRIERARIKKTRREWKSVVTLWQRRERITKRQRG
jgi:hypothetical protein